MTGSSRDGLRCGYSPRSRSRLSSSAAALLFLASGISACSDESAQAPAAQPAQTKSLAEVKDIVEMVIVSAYACSDYLKKPEVLTEHQKSQRKSLVEAGLSSAEADAFMKQVLEEAKAEPMTETQKQVGCEMINIKALKVE